MKIWIVGPQGCLKRDIYRALQEDKFNVGKLFTTLPDGDITYNRYLYKTYPQSVVNEMFENGQNIFVFEDRKSGVFTGLDFAEYDSHDVFVLTPGQFLSINTDQYIGSDSLVVWLDGSLQWRKNNVRYDDTVLPDDTTYNFNDVEADERIYYRSMFFAMTDLSKTRKNVIYFNEEEPLRVKTIIKTLAYNPKLRTDIIRGFTPTPSNNRKIN